MTTPKPLAEQVAEIRDDYDNCRLAGNPQAERIADTLLARIDELELEREKAGASHWFMSYRRMQRLLGSGLGSSTQHGACIVSEHPLEWCARYNAAQERDDYVDLMMPLWWSQDIPEGFDPEWEVEA